jgi:endonuclease/exonuclease/phosphatase family metal-dependent hydrolase
MKLLQLNTWSCGLAPEITKLLEREQPDIVCLQEVVRASETGKIIHSVDEILADYPFQYEYYSPLVEFDFMHGKAQRGNMILSQYPILEQKTFWTHGNFQPDFGYSVGYNAARGVAHCKIETPQGILDVVTTHGYHVREHKNGNDETLKACQLIKEYVEALDHPVVLTGDFNLVSTSESMNILNASMRNLCIEHMLTTTRNHLTNKTEVCDYILTSRDISVQSFKALDDVVSDHMALILTI